VQLDAPPLARYQGGARGFPATAPSATGAKVDRDSAPARAWTRELDDRQAAVLAAAPAVTPTARYRVAFASFSATLTAAQAQALRAQPGVAHVIRERCVRRTAAPPARLAPGDALAGSEAALMGLPTGLWKQLGGAAKAGAARSSAS
jgi:hypothetical protein